MLLVFPALAMLATAPDALAGDHSVHFAPAAPHVEAHAAHVDVHAGHAVAQLANAAAAFFQLAQQAPAADADSEAEATDPDDPGIPSIVYVDTTPHPTPSHLPASAADHRVEHRVAFDLGGAYGALANVDLGACKAAGLGTGYGKVTLAFDPDGHPGGVGVELPAGSSPAATACVEQAYGAVTVSPFDGSAISVSRAFFVKA
jgi:hypothetical protein